MKKILYTMLVTFLVLFLGQSLYLSSLEKRDVNFLNDAVYNNLKEGNIEEFIDGSLLVMGADSYYKKALYEFKTDNNINISIYLANVDKMQVLVTFFSNIPNIEKLNYLEVSLLTEASNINISREINLINPNGDFINGGFFIPVYIDENNFYFTEGQNKSYFSTIRSIDISLIYSDKQIKNKEYVSIRNNDEFNLEYNNVSNLELIDELYLTKKFNGKHNSYKKLEIDVSELVIPNRDNLKPYSNIIVKNLVIYGVVVLLVSLYILFRKQIVGLFTKHKISKK